MTTTTTESEVMVRLAVLETKLDGIRSAVDDTKASFEKRMDAIEEDLEVKIKQERTNTDLKVAALERMLEGKVDKTAFEPIHKAFWASIGTMAAAVFAAVWALVTKGG